MMVGVSPVHAWSYRSDERSLTISKKHPHYHCHFPEMSFPLPGTTLSHLTYPKNYNPPRIFPYFGFLTAPD